MRISCVTWLLFLLFSLHSASDVNVVYRDVKEFGAVGDGVTDDTMAIIAALTNDRSDNGQPFPSVYSCSTMHPAYVFFPKGVYLVTQTLPVVYYTEMVGDAGEWPTIKFVSKSNVDHRVLDVAGSWYPDVSQNNFYRHIRNFVVDMTDCLRCTGVHWKVAQATMLVNIHFKMGYGTNNQGMWMEDGSGGIVTDLVFEGGLFGMWVGNQQFTSRNITIRDASVAGIYLNWDWVWTFVGLTIERTPVGIDMGEQVGSLVVVDSSFSGITTAVIRSNAFDKNSNYGTNSIFLDNISYTMDLNNSTDVIVANGTQIVYQATSKETTGLSFAQGHMYSLDGTVKSIQQDVTSLIPRRPSILTVNGKYLQRRRPEFDPSTLLDVSTVGIVGDGITDVTAKLQKLLLSAAGKQTLYIPSGTYMISDTVYLPPGTQMIGEVWPVFMATGTLFANPKFPKPMFQVGEVGETGVVLLVDLLFSTNGPQPGAVLVEWNMHEPAGNPGGCGIWSVHFRIGGAVKTRIDPSSCPSGNGTDATASDCTGAYLLMHVTKSASIYVEDSWQWVADHDIDYVNQINVYNARGFLCESAGPVWLYGSAVEHSLYYQYNFQGASNIFMGAIQTETPYFQPSAVTPFEPNDPLDPTFCTDDFRCNMAIALNIQNSNNIFTYGTGLYSFFNTWNQDCLKTSSGAICQKNLVTISGSTNIFSFAFNTYGSEWMRTSVEKSSKATDNSNTFCSTLLFMEN